MKIKWVLKSLILYSPFLAAIPSPAASGPVGLWKAEGNANDSAGTNDGVLVNGTGFAPGVFGMAFSFDGINDEVRIPNSPDLAPTNGVTVIGWLITTGTVDFAGLVDKFVQDTVTSGYAVSMSGDNGFGQNHRGILRADLGLGSGYTTAFNQKRVDDGQPHQFALTCDGAQAFLYVDGVAGNAVTITNWVATNSQDLFFGVDTSSSSRHFQGQLDELAIYDRALTAEEVKALFDSGQPVLTIRPATPGFVNLSWPTQAVGFHLQASENLAPPNWADTPSGTNNPVSLPALVPNTYYRLKKP